MSINKIEHLNIGDVIKDCYMCGIGDLHNIGERGIIEAAGKDWVIIRTDNGEVIYTNISLEELSEF